MTILIGIVIVAVIILIAIFRGNRLKRISLGKILSASFSDNGSDSGHSILVITKVPENVPFMELEMSIDGEAVHRLKASEKGGKEVVRKVNIHKEGNVHYSIEAEGAQRVFDSQMQPVVIDYSASGSGDINLSFGDRLVIDQVLVLHEGSGSAYNLVLEKQNDYSDGTMPEDVAMAELDKLLDEE